MYLSASDTASNHSIFTLASSSRMMENLQKLAIVTAKADYWLTKNKNMYQMLW